MLVCPTTAYVKHQTVSGTGGGKIMSKSRPPRIISEVRKCHDSVRNQLIQFRPKISADLLVLLGSGPRWLPRRVQVRAGQLLLSPVQGCFSLTKQNDLGIRIPLRHLSLQAGPLPNSLSLVRGKAILLTMQTSNERHFDLWVKSIAIEIIRQTPLEDVKYLDVFSLATKEATVQPSPPSPTAASSTLIIETLTSTYNNTIAESSPPSQTTAPSVCYTCKPVIHFAECDVNKNIVSVHNNNTATTTAATTTTNQHGKSVCTDTVEVLLKKCQSSENYVPVKEKLVLFESLCRIGRGRSAEDVSMNNRVSLVATTKRARSMHDLTYFASGGVREICKYFETKFEDDGVPPTTVPHTVTTSKHIKRLVHSDTSLHKVAFNRNFENVSYA